MLIFDEINDSAVARESSKLFSLDGRYDVVATGSLLGISDLSIKHIPSGYDEYLTLKPLSFIEQPRKPVVTKKQRGPELD